MRETNQERVGSQACAFQQLPSWEGGGLGEL